MRVTLKDIIWIVSILLFAVMVSRFSCYSPEESDVQPSETIRTIEPPQRSEVSGPITYSIGSVDPRFNISKDKLLELVQEAEKLLEAPFDRPFFVYDEHSSFKINLQYDDRQKEYDEALKISTALQEQNASYNELIAQYEKIRETFQSQKEHYEKNAGLLKTKMTAYEAKVAYWNAKGGAPEQEFSALQKEREQLNSEAGSIEQESVVLNGTIAQQNALSAKLKEYAEKYNFEAEMYNGRYVKKREFEKGLYNGTAITIYQYRNDADLRMVIAHELGHAMGLDHAKDPKALMYPFLEKQQIDDFRLTPEDKELIKNSRFFRQSSL